MTQKIKVLVKEVAEKALAKGVTLSTAESCTGGGIATALTELAGSSVWFEGGIVSYSNNCKQKLLGVPEQLLEEFGAVSQQVAEAMAEGVLLKTNTQLSVAVSGIAGPEGGSDEKPVGTVWIAWQMGDNKVISEKFMFSGDRFQVRQQTVIEALKGFISLL